MSVDELLAIGWTRKGGVLVAPHGLHEPKPTELKEYRKPAARRVAACGTPAAYRRHRARKEDCARCAAIKSDKATRAGTR